MGLELKALLGEAYKDDMTIEEINAALSAVSLPTEDELKRMRDALSKSNSEAAEYKRQLRARQTEEETRAQEEKESREALQAAYDALLRQNTIAGYTASYLSLGYDEALSKATAEALVEGKMDVVFANQKKHNESLAQKMREELRNGSPKPDSVDSGDGAAMTLEKLRSMPLDERMDYAYKNPEQYTQLYGGK